MKQKDFPELQAMRSGVDHKFKISCREWSGFVRPLSCLEIIQSATATSSAIDKLPENQRIGITSSLYNAMHQLEIASTPDVGEPPTLPLSLLQMMTPDMINHLWKQYVRVTDMVNPSFEKMPKEELDSLVERLKKNSDPSSILIDLSISNLIDLSLHLSTRTQD